MRPLARALVTRLASGSAAAVGLACLASTAFAAPAAKPPARGRAVAPAPRVPAKPAAPPAPPPSVALTIDAPSPLGSWRMHVQNTGDVPLRLTADARLLAFEITPPGGKKAIHCALPADMRPAGDVERALVLPPKRSYSEAFDPRLYCFGANEAALVGGATVVAHLGFAAVGAKPAPHPSSPFVLSPFEGVEPAVGPAKEIVAAPFALAAAEALPPAAPATPPKLEAGSDPFPVTLSVAIPRHVDATHALDLAVTVTVTNGGARPVTLLFRPETIGFDLVGPSGAVRCSWPGLVGGNVREAFTTLAPKAKQSVSVVLGSLCTDDSLDQAGLYILRPRLDTRHASGATVGLSAFEGEIIGMGAMLLRIHHGRGAPRSVRPRLD